MYIEIASNGSLWIERAGKLKSMKCPMVDQLQCGDWCALFGEPENIDKKSFYYGSGMVHIDTWEIILCHKTLRTIHFVDKRSS